MPRLKRFASSSGHRTIPRSVSDQQAFWCKATGKSSSVILPLARQGTEQADTNEGAVINTVLSMESAMKIRLGSGTRTVHDGRLRPHHEAAKRAFYGWHAPKKDDAIQECLAKMWDQWSRLLMRGRDPEPMTLWIDQVRHPVGQI